MTFLLELPVAAQQAKTARPVTVALAGLTLFMLFVSPALLGFLHKHRSVGSIEDTPVSMPVTHKEILDANGHSAGWRRHHAGGQAAKHLPKVALAAKGGLPKGQVMGTGVHSAGWRRHHDDNSSRTPMTADGAPNGRG